MRILNKKLEMFAFEVVWQLGGCKRDGRGNLWKPWRLTPGAVELWNCCWRKSYRVAFAAKSRAEHPLPGRAAPAQALPAVTGCRSSWPEGNIWSGAGKHPVVRERVWAFSALGADRRDAATLTRAAIHTVSSCAGFRQAQCLTSLPAATAAEARSFPLLKLNCFSKNKLSSTFTHSE